MDAGDFRIPPGLTTNGLIARRYIARLIDSVVIVFLAGIAVGLLLPLFRVNAAIVPIVVGVFVVYGGLLESSRWQATIGKKMMGMRVFTTEGKRMPVGKALARGLVKDGPFVVLAMLPFGYILQLVWLALHVYVVHQSPVYQAIHDRVVGSFVAANAQTTTLNLSASA